MPAIPLHVDWKDYTSNGVGAIYVDVDAPLHHRGTDHTFYKNEWDTRGDQIFSDRDSKLAKAVVRALLQDGTGVSYVEMRNYTLCLSATSSAVSFAYIQQIMIRAMKCAGYKLIDEPKPAEITRIVVVSKHPFTAMAFRVKLYLHAVRQAVVRTAKRFNNWLHS